jgi:hypothetical protein
MPQHGMSTPLSQPLTSNEILNLRTLRLQLKELRLHSFTNRATQKVWPYSHSPLVELHRCIQLESFLTSTDQRQRGMEFFLAFHFPAFWTAPACRG